MFTRFEAKLEQYGGNLGRSAVELAKDWRIDKLLRQLQALLIVADAKQMFLLSGDGGDVIEPDAVGGWGDCDDWVGWQLCAGAAATALMENTEFSAREIVERSMKIAAEICISFELECDGGRVEGVVVAISRPQGPLGKWIMRGSAVVVALVPYLFWTVLTMVPGLSYCNNGRTFLITSSLSVAVPALSGWMYWWSFYEKARLKFIFFRCDHFLRLSCFGSGLLLVKVRYDCIRPKQLHGSKAVK